MSAKQRHKKRIKQRICDKLKLLNDQEEALHMLIQSHVSKARERVLAVLGIEATGHFLQQYGNAEQLLDRVYNNCELLLASTEDMIEMMPQSPNPTDDPLDVVDNYDHILCDGQIEFSKTENTNEQVSVSTNLEPAVAKLMDKSTYDLRMPPLCKSNTSESKISVSLHENEKQAVSGSVHTTLLKTSSDNDNGVKKEETVIEGGVLKSKSLKCDNKKKQKSSKKNKLELDCGDNGSKHRTNKRESVTFPSVKKTNVLKLSESDQATRVDNVGEKSMIVVGKVTCAVDEKTKENRSAVLKGIKPVLTGKELKDITELEAEINAMSEKWAENTFDNNKKVFKDDDIGNHEVKSGVNLDCDYKEVDSKIEAATIRDTENDTSPKLNTKCQVMTAVASDKISACLSPGTLVTGSDTSPKLKTKLQVMNAIASDKMITGLSPSALLTGKVTPVVVSEIISPWCFFVQHSGSLLKQLMQDICHYMSAKGWKEPYIVNPTVGTICLAQYSKDRNFYRAYVMQLFKKSTGDSVSAVDILFVDYGNREHVEVLCLRRLPEQFKSLPSQAICCALAGVKPNNKYCVWREEDILVFKQYVLGQQLSCTPICRSSDQSLPILVQLTMNFPVPQLMFTGGICIPQINIGQVMISRGSANLVETTEQIGLLLKAGEGSEEVYILSHRQTHNDLQISELCDSLSYSNMPGQVKQISELGDSSSYLNMPDQVKNTRLSAESVEEQVQSCDSLKKLDKSEMICDNKDVTLPGSNNLSVKYFCGNRANTAKKIKEESRDINTTSGNTLIRLNEDHELEIDKMVPSSWDDAGSERASVGSVSTAECSVITTTTASSLDLGDLTSDLGIRPDELLHDLHDLHLNPQGQAVMLAHINSPTDFYVHIISQKVGQTLDTLMKTLNVMFAKMTRRQLTSLSKKFEVAANKFCCAQFTQDNKFYRGLIKEIDTKSRVRVHYVDFGDEEWLPKRRIYPLPPVFVNVPRLALHCHLAYIKPMTAPTDSCADGQIKWPEGCVEKFVVIAGMEKTLHMHVVHGNFCGAEGNSSTDVQTLGVFLVDNTGTEEICINMELIREGFAQLIPDTTAAAHARGGDETAVVSENVLDSWDPMEEDFVSKRNTYKTDTDDAGVATTGYKAKDEQHICKYFSRGQECWRGNSCPFRHIRSFSGVTHDRDEVYAISDNQAAIIPDVGSWVSIEVSTILMPNHFYAILPLGSKSLDGAPVEQDKPIGVFDSDNSDENLDGLNSALNTEYSKQDHHGMFGIYKALGEIVAARFSQDKLWYRARVTDVAEGKVKVFFVDFGNTEWLPDGEVADIKPEFLHLPFQAIECFLTVEPCGNDQWSKEAKSYFRELVDGKLLVAYIKSRLWNGQLHVDLYDTSGEDDINIGDKLLEKGYGVKTESVVTAVLSNNSEIGTSSEMGSISPSVEMILCPG